MTTVTMPIEEYNALIKKVSAFEEQSTDMKMHDKEVDYINQLIKDVYSGVIPFNEAEEFYFFRTIAGQFILKNFEQFKEWATGFEP